MLYHLAYVSLSRFTLDEKVLSDILDISQRNNARDEITGVLMYHDKLFFQVLEGEQCAVEDCYYKRIFHDPRHSGMSLIWCNPVESRAFSDWAMGYAGPCEIGRYTKNTFNSLIYLKSDEVKPANTNDIALELARTMFSDFKRRG